MRPWAEAGWFPDKWTKLIGAIQDRTLPFWKVYMVVKFLVMMLLLLRALALLH